MDIFEYRGKFYFDAYRADKLTSPRLPAVVERQRIFVYRAEAGEARKMCEYENSGKWWLL